jgi:phage terminase large subunit GpA-like protein
VEVPGPGYLHFSSELDAEHYQQLTAEKLVTRYHKGRPRREWVLVKGRRNEALDLKVYNFAAAAYAGISRMKMHQWETKARELGPNLFNVQPASEEGRGTAPGPDGPAQVAATVAPAEKPAWLDRNRTGNWITKK